jgi:hypothetical protein
VVNSFELTTGEVKNFTAEAQRAIIFHLPSSQRQMKRKVISALSAPLR